MIKSLSLLFLLAFSIIFNNGFKCANVVEIEREELQVANISGAKRRFDDSQETTITKEDIFEDALGTAISSFQATKIVNHPDDPAANFLDKLIRRSFMFKFTVDERNTMRLWDLPCSLVFDRKWHTDMYFFILRNDFDFSEEVLIEYFEYVIEEEQEDYEIDWIVRATCKLAVDKQYLELFSKSFQLMVSDRISSNFALRLLLTLKSRTDLETLRLLRSMALIIINRFPRLAFDPQLRITGFKGSETGSNAIFIHFLPIYRTLILENEREFVTEQDAFDDFSLFHLGDLEKITPMGFGGLAVINQMVLRSKINLSAFEAFDREDLKPDIIARVFDAVLLGLEPVEMALELSKSESFSIFESYCKYSMESDLNTKQLEEVLYFLIKKCRIYAELDFIFAVIAYKEVPQSVWDNLRERLKEERRFSGMIDFILAVIRALERFDPKTQIKLSTEEPSNIELNLSSAAIDDFSDVLNWPFQLEVARVFLARSCGIPLESTQAVFCHAEGVEWQETVAFINFYVERAAAIAGYTGHVVNFT